MADILNLNYAVRIECPDKNIHVYAPIPEDFMFDMAASYEQPFGNGILGKVANIMRYFGVRFVTQALTAQLWQGSSDSEMSLDLEFHAETSPMADVIAPIKDLLRLVVPSNDSSVGLLTAPGPRIDEKIFGAHGVAIARDWMENAKASGNAIGSTALSLLNSIGLGNMTNLQTSTRDANNNAGPTSDPTGSGQYGSSYTASAILQSLRNNISIKIGTYCEFRSVVVTNIQKTYTNQFDENGTPMHAKVNIRFRPLFMLVEADLDGVFVGSGTTTQSSTSSGSTTSSLNGPTPSTATAVRNQALSLGNFKGIR